MFQLDSLRSAGFVCLCLILFFSTTGLAADQPLVSSRLQNALIDDHFPWRGKDGSLTVWVYFQDKGLQDQALEEALQKAEKNLSERTAWRRSKMKKAGEALVDTGDLPVNPAYLDQIKATGAKFRRESRWLNAASFQVNNTQVQMLQALPFIKKLDLVGKFQRRPVPVTPMVETDFPDAAAKAAWTIDYGANLAAMEQAGVPAVHELGVTGQGVIIGMLDSGFHFTHEALAGIPVLGTYDFVNDDTNVDNEEGDPDSAKDHGTMTMSTAVGNMPGQLVAPAFGASVVLAKTEDIAEEVPIEEDQWVAGLEWVETFGVDIVSSSLGYLDWYDFSDLDGETAVTTIAADLAVGRGIVVVNSAGNERGTSWNHIIAPADGDSVITVGAVTSAGVYSSFSSPGPSYDGRIKPDVAALGSNNTVANPNDDSGYRSASGTSFSCPLTSGVAALVLSYSPNLTPMQVREALRETASRSDSPDNDYGWGIINAQAALNYYAPNFVHEPLHDTENTASAYQVEAQVTARLGLDFATLNYRLDGAAWQQVAMNPTGEPDIFAGEIPNQNAGVVVDYYLSGGDLGGTVAHLPALAPGEFFTFMVGPDVTAPTLVHTSLLNQAMIVWPPLVSCSSSDNLGVDRLELTFQLNGGLVQGPFSLNADGADVYSLLFPLSTAEIKVGDLISYTLTSYDLAGIPNTTTHGPHFFSLIEALGVVLVLDDAPTESTDLKFGPDKRQVPMQESGKSSATTIAGWLAKAGYVADTLEAGKVSVSDFQNYQAVILSSGSNASPVVSEGLRQALQDWASSGGKILVEGGEIGYDSLSNPGYEDFSAQVLHANNWNGDTAGDLELVSGQGNHPLLNVPNPIADMVEIEYDSYGDEDAVSPDAETLVIMATRTYSDSGGILVYDDNLAPQSGQIVFFAFNVEALVPEVGEDLILNAVHYLLAPESPPISSLSGTITLSGQTDHSGVLVMANGSLSTTTNIDGDWILEDLYGGLYDLIISKEGWGARALHLDLEDGQHLTELDLTLAPIVQVDYSVSPGVAIPDNQSSGLLSAIVVPEEETGMLSGVSVDIDITHPWIGDLTVKLISPDLEQIVLHNRTGSSGDDIQGNWPLTLTVDGPGNLDDLIGLQSGGTWFLFVSDSVGSDTGTLNSWGLHFLLPGVISATDDQPLPRVTRLNPNVPNPFNPNTRISFDLARGGMVQLGIYDLRGMMIRRLVAEKLPAGSHAVPWDGMDGNGRSVSSGVYLYRLQSPEGIRERKMLLVR